MLQLIKKILPKPVKKWLIAVKQKTYDQWQKKVLFKRMQLKHAELIKQIKGKKKVKVVFLAIHKSVWKVDPVFKRMLEDPFFEPEVLVCPYIPYGEGRMLEDMEEAYTYFVDKGYPVRKSLKEDGTCLALSEINPDVVFFTNPHNLTRKEYYEDAYLNYLSCYVPYHHEVGSFGDNDAQHNQFFHNAVWKIFSAHNDSFFLAKLHAENEAKNMITTGFPAMENLIELKRVGNYLDVWKTNDGRKRVIWAPHHLISEEINQSNFLEYAEFFLHLAKHYQEKVVWAFKPHPILRSKLLEHPQWGQQRTDDYFSFWENQDYTQLELGTYEDLFLSSDCMIHDCGSFLAEYLYTEKPVMYLLNEKHTGQFFNTFGKKALTSCRIGRDSSGIESFLSQVIDGNINGLTEAHKVFIEKNVAPYFSDELPSIAIVRVIKDGIAYEC